MSKEIPETPDIKKQRINKDAKALTEMEHDMFREKIKELLSSEELSLLLHGLDLYGKQEWIDQETKGKTEILFKRLRSVFIES